MTARIETRTGEVVSEIFATRIELNWNPLTEDGVVVFRTEKFTTMNGELLTTSPAGAFEHSFSSIMGRTWDVPDGQGGTVQVPTVLLMGTIKTVFDTLFNERVAAEAASQEP